jgi:hypothetical protein
LGGGGARASGGGDGALSLNTHTPNTQHKKKQKNNNQVDGLNFLSLPAGASPELVLRLGDGDALRTFADRDGWFALRGVPPGTHHLSVHSPKFLYPEVELVVGGGDKGGGGGDGDGVRAHYVLNKAVQLPAAPLVLRPVAVRQHYEVRKPVDVWSFVKSPYGLMICFMVFGIFVFPMLKVDPGEVVEE